MGTPAGNMAYEVTDKKGERKTNTIGYRILGLILVILLAHNLAIAAYHGAMSTGWRGTDESQYYRAAKRLVVGKPLYYTPYGQLCNHRFIFRRDTNGDLAADSTIFRYWLPVLAQRDRVCAW